MSNKAINQKKTPFDKLVSHFSKRRHITNLKATGIQTSELSLPFKGLNLEYGHLPVKEQVKIAVTTDRLL